MPSLAPVEPGTILAGKYRIERVLGEGGMGVVVAATHVQLEQRVAIKFLRAEALTDPDIVTRFAREARAAAKIESEHVARVIDVGTLDFGSPYMVMEYLEGRDLSAHLEAQGPLPVEEAVGYVLEACEAIAEAHAHGIVHRDLKPANLFLAQRADRRLTVKVLDFGISKSQNVSLNEAKLTRTRAIMGSPLYMAPEQMRASRDADARSDIWSLGCILYEALTGQTPYVAETITEIIARVLGDELVPMTVLRPELPRELDDVVARCLAKSPADRYQDVGAFAAELARFGPPRAEASVERITRVLGRSLPPAGARPRLGSRPDTAGLPLAATDASWGGSAAHPVAPSRARRRALTVGAVAMAALTAGVAVVVLRPGGLPLRSVAAVAAAKSEPSVAASPAASMAAAAGTTPREPETSASASSASPNAAGLEAPADEGAGGGREGSSASTLAPASSASSRPVEPHAAEPKATPRSAPPPAPPRSTPRPVTPSPATPRKNPLQIDLK